MPLRPSARPLALAALLSLAAALSGCASTPPASSLPGTDIRRTDDFRAITTASSTRASADSIYAAPAAAMETVRLVYGDLGLPPNNVEPARMIIGVVRQRVRRTLNGVSLTQYLDCGTVVGVPTASTEPVDLTVLSQLIPAGTGSVLRTSVTAVAIPTGGARTEPRECSSTGSLEKRIAALVRQR